MAAQLGMSNDMIRRNDARRDGLRDHLVRAAESRQLRAEAFARGLHLVWTDARGALARLLNGKAREPTPAANGRQTAMTLGRASLGDAFRRDRERLAEAFRHYILEPYARRRRRRIAITELRMMDDHLLADIGLTRGQIELAVDGMLAPREEPRLRPAEEALPAEQGRDELPLAA